MLIKAIKFYAHIMTTMHTKSVLCTSHVHKMYYIHCVSTSTARHYWRSEGRPRPATQAAPKER